MEKINFFVNTLGQSYLLIGSERQTADYLLNLTQATNGNLIVDAHSQGTLLTYAAMLNAKSELQNILKDKKDTTLKVGSLTYDEVDKASSSVKNNSSNLIAKENLVLDSLTDINIQGSNLKADENLVLNSTVGDINILNTTDSSNEDIKEKHAKASVNLTVQNEYVETAQAVKSAVESAEQLKQTKDDYSNYKSEVKNLENTLVNLKQSYKNKEVGIDYSDIEDLIDIIDNLKSQEKYYVAAIAAATADLASKTVAIATQGEAAATSGATAGFSVGVSLDVEGSKTKTNTTSQTSNASNLNGKNIIINTDEKLSTNINVVGSNVIADENLYINTNNLNVKASQDNYINSNDSENVNGSIAFTMYGGGGGTVGLGYGQQNSNSNSIINNNSQLIGNNVNINASNDAIFQGANIRANDTLNLNVGNDLVLESLRDEYSSNSKGFNVNAGLGFGSAGAPSNRIPSLDVGKQTSSNAGMSVNNGTTLNKQTVLSSITGDKVNVNVGNNTHLKGALLASGNYDENGNFVDNKNLNFNTNTLTFENLSNTSFSSNQSIGGNFNYNLDSTKIVDGKEKPQQGGISSVGYNSSTGLDVNVSKTLATLGEGNITIKDKENSDDLTKLNTDTSNINKDLYSSSTRTSVDATLDTRLLTEDGRKQIAEDVERTKRLGQSISEVLSSDAFKITDTFNHIDDVQKDLDVQKALALKNDGKTVDIIENQFNYSQTQIDTAINDYAQIYASTYGVNIDIVKMAILNKYGSTYTNEDNINSNIYVDKILNQNALTVSNTLGHEVAHVRQNQNQTYLRETTDLQEEYSNIFGKYSSSGLDFSSNTYNNVQLSTIPTLNLNLTSQDINTLKTNTNLYLQDLNKANSGDGRIDDESYWTIQDMDRTKDLQSDNASDRIKALIETGNTESEILKQVINDGTLRGLSQEEFDKIYSTQKQQVDDANKLADNMILSLKASELALGGREVVKNIAEAITKKSMELSLKNAGFTASSDLLNQTVTQLVNNEQIRQELLANPAEAIKKIVDNIDWTQTAVSVGIGSTGTKTSTNVNNVIDRVKARNTVQNQLDKATSPTLQNKLNNRVEKIDNQIIDKTKILLIPEVTKTILNTEPKEIVKEIIQDNLPEGNTNEN